MVNQTAAVFGVILAIFVAMGLMLVSCSALRHNRRDANRHNRAHHTRLDRWINMRNLEHGTGTNTITDNSSMPRFPPSALTRAERSQRHSAIRFDDGFQTAPIDKNFSSIYRKK